MRIPIVNLDAIGIIQDLSPHDLPLQAWSSGKNVRIVNGRTQKISGHQAAFAPLIDPKFLLPYQSNGGYFWLYLDDNYAKVYTGGITSDITRSAGNFAANGAKWNGSVLNGIPIFNVETDVPQQWLPPQAAQRLTNLSAWPSTWRAKNLKSFKSFLVALGVTKGSVLNPYGVNWSHPADPGSVPISWDVTDPTRDAGEISLADTSGFVLDQLPMRDVNLIYKEDSVHSMTYVGGEYIFAFKRILNLGGLLMPNGLAAFTPKGKGEQHIVFGPNDIYIHDGMSAIPILEGRMRDWLYNNLDSSGYRNSFIVHNSAMKEIWICFPMVGSVLPTMALIWNYNNDTTTLRELPGVLCAANGQVTEIVSGQNQSSWSADPDSWDMDSSTWGSSSYQPVTSRLLMATAGDTRKTLVMDLSTQFDGVDYDSYVERIGLTVTGQTREGKPIEDSETVKLLTEVWPRVQGNVGTVLDVFVGTQDDRGKYPEWQGPYPFVIGVDTKVNPLVSGRILSIRFACRTPSMWQLHGYDIDVRPVGAY